MAVVLFPLFCDCFLCTLPCREEYACSNNPIFDIPVILLSPATTYLVIRSVPGCILWKYSWKYFRCCTNQARFLPNKNINTSTSKYQFSIPAHLLFVEVITDFSSFSKECPPNKTTFLEHLHIHEASRHIRILARIRYKPYIPD